MVCVRPLSVTGEVDGPALLFLQSKERDGSIFGQLADVGDWEKPVIGKDFPGFCLIILLVGQFLMKKRRLIAQSLTGGELCIIAVDVTLVIEKDFKDDPIIAVRLIFQAELP